MVGRDTILRKIQARLLDVYKRQFCKFSFLLIIHALKPPRFLVCDNLRKIFCKINPTKDIIRGDRNNIFCTKRKQRKGFSSYTEWKPFPIISLVLETKRKAFGSCSLIKFRSFTRCV